MLRERGKNKKMKIAYVGIPAHGHTNPALPVMRELVARGHEALYYNTSWFREKVAPTGVDFHVYPEPLPDERAVTEALGEIITASRLLAGMSERLTPFMLDEMARERPDVILYDSVAMWGYLAARTQRIPYICSITRFVLNGSQGSVGAGEMARYIWTALPHAPALKRWKRRMTRRYGKRVVGGITEYGDLNLVFTSREFHPPNRFVDERFRFIGPSIDPARRAGTVLSDIPLGEMGDEPTVYIALGTISNVNLAFYCTAFEAFGGYPARFILAAGQNTDIARLGAIPANFVVRQYAPQLEILGRAQAFITHGGMNSVHEGLYFAVPEIVVPHQLEQALNGKRVAETGAGILLGARPPYGHVSAKQLRAALDAVLNEAIYRENAQRIGETLRAAGGYMRAADEVEAFAKMKFTRLASL
jgi:MGT family glycosyltransferase